MSAPPVCWGSALYETVRWNKKQIRFREHTFLDNINVPASLLQNRVVVTVAAMGERAPLPSESNSTHVTLP